MLIWSWTHHFKYTVHLDECCKSQITQDLFWEIAFPFFPTKLIEAKPFVHFGSA